MPAIHKTDCAAHDYSEGTGDTGSGYARERADIAGRSQPADISAISWCFLDTSRCNQLIFYNRALSCY